MASDRIEIVKELRALEQFCTFKSTRTGDEQERFMKDYLADIQEFSIEAIRQACASWRRSGSTKFPTSGQLIPLIKAALPSDQQPRYEPWRPATEDEYQSMTIREKIREHLILADEAGGKAGPMFRNTSGGGPITKASGIHLTPEQMPPTWRKWRDIQANHLLQVKRLREYLRAPPRMGAAE